jgi:hypothetical protein
MLQPRQERRSILSQVKSIETQGEKAGCALRKAKESFGLG